MRNSIPNWELDTLRERDIRPFNHTNATSLAEIKIALADGKTNLIAGSTDLLGTLKDNVLPTYPTALINIKTVPGLDYIKEEGSTLKIGATARLADIIPAACQKADYKN